jgi:electron transport complex protein RnfG
MSGAEEQEIPLATSIRRHSLRLGIFAFGAALLLALVSSGTAVRIEAQRLAAELEALNAVLPPSVHDNDLLSDSFMLSPDGDEFRDIALLGLSVPRPAWIARIAGEATGVILPLETADGYSGTILLLIGLDAEGVISGVRTLQHSETPGLGDKIELRKSEWILTFDNRSLQNTDPLLWRVKKDGGEFDQFVGATITPRAVVAAVHDALQFFEANRTALLNHPTGGTSP